jgi:hypothetical protein
MWRTGEAFLAELSGFLGLALRGIFRSAEQVLVFLVTR